MKRKQFIRLLKKYRNGTATKREQRFVESYYNFLETEQGLEDWLNTRQSEEVQATMLHNIWETIKQQETGSEAFVAKRFITKPLRMAAVVAALLATGIMFYLIRNRPNGENKNFSKNNEEQPFKNDIHPGGRKAVLTLANGEKIVLDTASKGSLGQYGSVNIRKQESGELVYKTVEGKEDVTAYNDISIPLGGEYKLVLSDGTKVWLNAGSSLHYPVAFNGRSRKVTLRGEGYFEVAKRTDQPFIVEAGGAEIKVLGTHFNVNAYDDEKGIKTTLAEGAVRVSSRGKGVILAPGQQAVVDNGSGSMQMKTVDVDRALAWKNGLFYFDNTNITMIMREVARWYDVQVIYKTDNLKTKNFSGIVSRYGDVGALLQRMELTGTIHFELKDRTIVVKN